MKFYNDFFPYLPFVIIIAIGITIYIPNRIYFPIKVIILPLAILLSLVALILAISKVAKENLIKAQICISMVLILNYIYYPLYDFVLEQFLNHSLLNIAYATIGIILVKYIWRMKPSYAYNLLQIFSFFAFSLIFIIVANLSISIIMDVEETANLKTEEDFDVQLANYINEDLLSQLNTRDFYFLVLDRYPGEEILFANQGYSNKDFYENLTNLGFLVLQGSRSNYGATDKSIPSMLNMNYLDKLKNTKYNEENNILWKFFKSQGFTFIFLPSNWITTTRNDYADVILNPYPMHLDRESKLREFQKIMFFQRTFFGNIYYSLMYILFNESMPSVSIGPLQERFKELDQLAEKDFNMQWNDKNQSRDRNSIHVSNTLENISHVPKISNKKFVFAHVHLWEYLDGPTENYIQNANIRIESLVKKLITESYPAPVIVLLSDHGEKPRSSEILKANISIYRKYACYPNDATEEDILTSWYPLNNFEAFYLPDGGNKIIYPGITPVNIWRAILNYYFKTKFLYLEDRSYWYNSRLNRLCEVKPINQIPSRYVYIYNNTDNFKWSGIMGENSGNSLDIDLVYRNNLLPKNLSKINYNSNIEEWAGVFIQYPSDPIDWRRGPNVGLNLTGAREIIFYAKGEKGGEIITWGYGYDKPNYKGLTDSSYERRIETLTDNWTRYQIDLNGKDLSYISGLFLFYMDRANNPNGATFYMDNITYMY
jgi:hypothetical protein